MRVLPLLAVALQLAAAPPERPNLLFMMADQMRYDRLGVVSAGDMTSGMLWRGCSEAGCCWVSVALALLGCCRLRDGAGEVVAVGAR